MNQAVLPLQTDHQRQIEAVARRRNSLAFVPHPLADRSWEARAASESERKFRVGVDNGIDAARAQSNADRRRWALNDAERALRSGAVRP